MAEYPTDPLMGTGSPKKILEGESGMTEETSEKKTAKKIVKKTVKKTGKKTGKKTAKKIAVKIKGSARAKPGPKPGPKSKGRRGPKGGRKPGRLRAKGGRKPNRKTSRAACALLVKGTLDLGSIQDFVAQVKAGRRVQIAPSKEGYVLTVVS
jgi:hypothetical protein